MNELSVYVLAAFDDEWPCPVAAVILARDKYDAEDQAEAICEKKEWDLADFDIMEWYEDDDIGEVYVG